MSGPSFAPLTAGDALKLRRVAAQVLPQLFAQMDDDLGALAVAYNCAAVFLSLRRGEPQLTHPAQVLERFSLEELAQYAQLLREGVEWGVNESFDREVGR